MAVSFLIQQWEMRLAICNTQPQEPIPAVFFCHIMGLQITKNKLYKDEPNVLLYNAQGFPIAIGK